ncbi:UDP-3-O-(3-hydroxymyristoyl)glucosamine N-acyltransferase [Niabella insulamsoli]|uniref:UDP-3-O-(3-hydroxymyristoyl)glucosamine N-acyltransferase n=1 Tax=Niabella insulamsoli TaxID=3144874 RepID=UPI0031FE0EFF
MVFSASQIALLINGTVEGNAEITVHSFGKIEEAGAGQLSFLANPKYEDYLYSSQASIVIVNESLELKKPVAATLIRVKDAYSAFAALLGKYQELKQQQLKGVQQPVYIAASASYGEDVFIGAFCYLGENVKIGKGTKIYPGAYLGDHVVVGDHCTLHPGVKILHSCQIGNSVTVHAGTVIGSDGFGFAPQADGSFSKVPQIGNVVVEDDVEIGANATIDRATIGSTIIRKGAKLDNLIQIAHNVEIGNSTVVAAQAGISGSTKVGKGVMIGGQAGIVGHLHIGDGAKINAQSGVSKNLEAGKAVTGSPAHEYTSALRSQALSRKLPELEKRVKDLEQLLQQMKPA